MVVKTTCVFGQNVPLVGRSQRIHLGVMSCENDSKINSYWELGCFATSLLLDCL
jgi:hypothetical protein